MRVRGGNFEPIESVDLLELLGVSDGAVILFRLEEPEDGAGPAILTVVRRGPDLQPRDAEVL